MELDARESTRALHRWECKGKEHMGSHRWGTERGNTGDHISWAPLLRALVLNTGMLLNKGNGKVCTKARTPRKLESLKSM